MCKSFDIKISFILDFLKVRFRFLPFKWLSGQSVDLWASRVSFVKQHFHMRGFALDLALKERLNATRKWAIELSVQTKCTILIKQVSTVHQTEFYTKY